MSLLDRTKEKHSGPEPRVVADDVREILVEALSTTDPERAVSADVVAEAAGISTRTVYRVIQNHSESLSLKMADALVLACGRHLRECRLRWPDGEITSYQEYINGRPKK